MMKQLMLGSHIWLVPVALTLTVFDLNATKAIAQTTYEFEAIYNVEVTLKEIAPNILEATLVGESADAPYNLTQLMSMSYAQVDPNTGVSTASPDAAAFGLQGLPILTDKLFGSGDDSLTGTSTATNTTDITNFTGSGVGTLTITSGEGRFSGATGTLSLTDSYTISPDPTAPLIGQALVSGSIKVVPEPGGVIGTLAGIGAIGIGFLLRRRNCKIQLAQQSFSQASHPGQNRVT